MLRRRRWPIAYRDFDNIGRNQVDTIQSSQDRPELLVDQPPVSGVPVAGATVARKKRISSNSGDIASCLFGALTSRVQGIDVQREIHGLLSSNALSDLLDDTVGADCVDLTCLDDLKSAVAIVLVITRPAESGADAGVDVRVVSEQAFLRGVVEVGSMVYTCHLRRRAAEDLGAPCLGVSSTMKWITKLYYGANTYRYPDGCRSE